MADQPDLRESPSQTAGPYVHIGCAPNAIGLGGVWEADLGAAMITGPAEGPRMTLSVAIFDGAGDPLRDALVEIWQPDAAGRFAGQPAADPHFTGWGRQVADPETGCVTFDTLRPGQIAWDGGRMQAPHVTLWIAARGINLALQTRAYLADEDAANAIDPVLADLVPPDRVTTLLAQPDGPGRYHLDIRLQGAGETVFFDI